MNRARSVFFLLLKALMVVCAGLYVVVLLLAYRFQDALMFPAPTIEVRELDSVAADWGMTPFSIHTDDGVELYGLHRPSEGRRAILVFHGNGGSARMGLWFGQALPGVDVISFSYRGYPGSDVVPIDEAGLIRDARAAFDYVTDELHIQADHIVLHGQSLGGGVVNLLADDLQRDGIRVAGLSLDSTFESALSVATDHYRFLPVEWLFRHPFRSDERAPHLDMPVFMIHGTDDTLIDVSHARRMVNIYPNASLVEVAGMGHGQWLLDDRDARKAWDRFMQDRLAP